jgi:hypothetical protein
LLCHITHAVDEEVFLHSESDPRYRGSAIPSKAFKCLQKMTDGSQSHNNNESNAQDAQAGKEFIFLRCLGVILDVFLEVGQFNAHTFGSSVGIVETLEIIP